VHYRALFGHADTDRAAVEDVVTTLLRGMAADFAELSGRRFGHKHDLK